MKTLDVTTAGEPPEFTETAISALAAWAVDLAERDIAAEREAPAEGDE